VKPSSSGRESRRAAIPWCVRQKNEHPLAGEVGESTPNANTRARPEAQIPLHFDYGVGSKPATAESFTQKAAGAPTPIAPCSSTGVYRSFQLQRSLHKVRHHPGRRQTLASAQQTQDGPTSGATRFTSMPCRPSSHPDLLDVHSPQRKPQAGPAVHPRPAAFEIFQRIRGRL